MSRTEVFQNDTIDAMLEVIRREPASDEARATCWSLWLLVRRNVERRIARHRAPAYVGAEDFRLFVLEEAERRFLDYASKCDGAKTLPGLLRRIADTAFLDAIRRHEVRFGPRVDLYAGPGLGPDGVGVDDSFGASAPSEAGFDDAHVDPTLVAERRERSRKVLEALEALSRRSDLWCRAAKAIVLRVMEQRPRSEVAAILGVQERTVDRDIQKSLEELGVLLTDLIGSPQAISS